jgi:glucose-1-phosphate thymidylyltransferase
MTKLSLEDGTAVTGLIPAAGRATRLGDLPYSKELLPVPDIENGSIQLAIEYSVRFLLQCGVADQRIIVSPVKEDIPGHLGNGARFGASISFDYIADSPGVPHSLDTAYASIAANDVVLVFPDIMFEPSAAIASLLADWRSKECDVLLPLVPSDRGDKVDIVSVSSSGIVERILPKPGAARKGWTWVAAAWSPAFSLFLHQFVGQCDARPEAEQARETYMGDVMNAAIEAGLIIRAEKCPSGAMIDIGTPGDYAAAWQRTV